MCKLIGPTFNEEVGFSKKKKKKEEEEASYSPTSFPLSSSLGFLNIRCC